MARRPPTYEKFIGQREVVRLLDQHTRGSRQAGTPFPNTLITGIAGVGKSRLAGALAASNQVEFNEATAAKDMRRGDLYKKLLECKHGDVFFIDEAHLLPGDCRDLLLGAIAGARTISRMEENKGRWSTLPTERVELEHFTLVAATDKPGALGKAMLSRFGLRVELGPYSVAELRAIAEQLCREEGVCVSTHALTLLAKAARGIPREVTHLVELLQSYIPDAREITKKDLRRFLDDHGWDEDFLRPLDRRYLLALRGQERPTSLQHLAAVVGVDRDYLVDSVETVLRRLGYVEVHPTGRKLSCSGAEMAEKLYRQLEADDETQEVQDGDE